jgi:DNA-directed RNA polymerase subunit RPC12/RpoP
MSDSGLCDICNDELPSPRLKLIDPKDMRAAVARGFDPVYLGIAPSSDRDRRYPAQQSPYFKGWSQTVGVDETDWAICLQCWPHIEPYLKGGPQGSTALRRRAPSPAAESFRCSDCGHEFAEDNPDYPKAGQPIRLHHDIKCANCKKTIVEAGRVKRGAFAIVGGAVLGLFVGSIAVKAIFGVESAAISIVCALAGIAAGIAFETYARADLHRRLAFLAAESAQRSR